MSECVRKMTAKELIEQSNIENKDLILSRIKESDCRMQDRINCCEKIIGEQRDLIEAYRIVLSDMIYSNWISKH